MAKLQSGTTIYGSANVNTRLFVLGANTATSNLTGALIVSGGIGVSGNVWSSGNVVANNINTTSGTITGNLAVSSITASTGIYGPHFGSGSGLTGISLTTGVTGTLPIGNGGTNTTTTPTAGALAYGTGTAYAFSTTGTSGQILVSGGSGSPIWAANSITVNGTSVSLGGSITIGTPITTATTGTYYPVLVNALTGTLSQSANVALSLNAATGILSAIAVTSNTGFFGSHFGSGAGLTSISLTTGVTGTLPIGNGGTNSTATPTAGAIAYGTGTAFAWSTATGTAGQILVSGGSGAPIWAANSITINGTSVSLGGSVTVTSASSAYANVGNTIPVTTVTTGTFYPVLINALTGNLAANANVALSFNAATGNLSANAVTSNTGFFGSHFGSGAGLNGTAASLTAGSVTTTLSSTNANYTIAVNNGTSILYGTATYNPSTGVLTAGTFSGSGASLTSIPNGALTNSSLTIGSTSVSLGSTVSSFAGVTLTSPTFTTPALGTPASGTLTNCTFPTLNQNTTGSANSATYVTGSATVQNSALANSSVTIGSTSVSLGSTVTSFAGVTLTSPTFTTPALGTPASGTLTNCTGYTGSAGSVANALTVSTGLSLSSGTTYNGSAALTISNAGVTGLTGTTNQISVSGSTGSVTLSTPQSIATTSSVQFGSFGVGTAASGTTGEIRATNNITAYFSDRRLKKNITPINNAISKVMQISGVTFESNETAAEYGYTDDKEQVGVIAQEIEKVLPQVVVPAPFDIAKNEDGTEYSKSGENYKTVQYEKLVPLLIQAIKEQQKQIDELKQMVASFSK